MHESDSIGKAENVDRSFFTPHTEKDLKEDLKEVKHCACRALVSIGAFTHSCCLCLTVLQTTMDAPMRQDLEEVCDDCEASSRIPSATFCLEAGEYRCEDFYGTNVWNAAIYEECRQCVSQPDCKAKLPCCLDRQRWLATASFGLAC